MIITHGKHELEVAWSDEDGVFVARVHGTSIAAHGDTVEEALAEVREALDAVEGLNKGAC